MLPILSTVAFNAKHLFGAFALGWLTSGKLTITNKKVHKHYEKEKEVPKPPQLSNA
jgi:hypothetical protein